jgi:hypothetical protein
MHTNNIMIKVNFIISYNASESEMYDMQWDTAPTESDFITYIFDKIELPWIKQLAKISCCQMLETDGEQVLDFLMKRRGKYYFSEDSDNDDVKYWNEFRDQYIRTNTPDES